MILIKSPLRISFIGGGTDFPDFFKLNDGGVISTTIDKSLYVAINVRSESEIRVSYSRTEIVNKIDLINHDIIRESLRLFDINSHLEIATIADVPTRGTGLGTSSSLCVAMLCGLNHLKKVNFDSDKLAKDACKLEIDILDKPIGLQDQYAAAFGGFNRIDFKKNGDVLVNPLNITADKIIDISSWFKLLPINIRKNSEKSLRETIDSINDPKKISLLMETRSLLNDMEESFVKFDVMRIAEILNIGWNLKRNLGNSISSPQIDSTISGLINEGLLAAKIVGAGGGGYLLLFGEPDWFESRLSLELRAHLIHLNFSTQGARLVYSDDLEERS